MVVFVVSFEEEMERSLARLFLQQFEVTQSKVPLTPHCEFRRPNQLTTELKSVERSLIGDTTCSHLVTTRWLFIVHILPV